MKKGNDRKKKSLFKSEPARDSSEFLGSKSIKSNLFSFYTSNWRYYKNCADSNIILLLLLFIFTQNSLKCS